MIEVSLLGRLPRRSKRYLRELPRFPKNGGLFWYLWAEARPLVGGSLPMHWYRDMSLRHSKRRDWAKPGFMKYHTLAGPLSKRRNLKIPRPLRYVPLARSPGMSMIARSRFLIEASMSDFTPRCWKRRARGETEIPEAQCLVPGFICGELQRLLQIFDRGFNIGKLARRSKRCIWETPRLPRHIALSWSSIGSSTARCRDAIEASMSEVSPRCSKRESLATPRF